MLKEQQIDTEGLLIKCDEDILSRKRAIQEVFTVYYL